MVSGASQFRPDIQGLRAVAVLLVLAYHVWPGVVPGGYVGVDVFFVISGYLITGVLLGAIQAEGRLSFSGFYSRRIKRLLPAATVVLITAALCSPLLPESRRLTNAIEIAASALYAQNLWLSHQARDYLTADDPASLVQHYWSLSVEEQFYIAWPVLLWLGLQLARRLRVRPKAMLGAVIAVVLVATLAYGIWLTAVDASQAYFSTLARAWELALGGVWAVLSSERRALSPPFGPVAVLGAAGVLGIGSAALLFDEHTAFPGYAALLPTLGAAAIIAAGSLAPRWPGDQLLRNPLMQYIGDRSYALYLWHWPVLMLFEARLARELGAGERVLVVAASIVLAHATKRWVEDPCRRASFAAASAREPFALAALSIVISVSAAAGVYQINAPTQQASWARPVLGARALEQPGYDYRKEPVDALVPPPVHASLDIASAHQEGCYQNIDGTAALVCAYGSAVAKKRIALVGDSHAAHWFPAFQEMVANRDLRFFGIAKKACAFSLSIVEQDDQARPYTECLAWTKNVIALLAKHKPDLILISQSPAYRIDGARPNEVVDHVAHGMASAWRELASHGLRVIALASTPWFPTPKLPRECVAVSRDWQRDCVLPRATVLPRDALRAAATESGTVLIDLNDGFCAGDSCAPVAGGALIYRDNHHITATYARSMASHIERALAREGVVLERK